MDVNDNTERRLGEPSKLIASMSNLSVEDLAEYIDSILEPADDESIPSKIDSELERLIATAVSGVRKRTTVLNADVAQRLLGNLPVGHDLMERRRELGLPRGELARAAHIKNAPKRLDLLENETVPAHDLFTRDELLELINTLGSVPSLRDQSSEEQGDPSTFDEITQSLTALARRVHSASADATFRSAESALLAWAARLEGERVFFKFFRYFQWSHSTPPTPEDIADLCFRVSVHHCSYLRDPDDVAVELDPVAMKLRVPWAFGIDPESPEDRPSERSLRMLAIARGLADFHFEPRPQRRAVRIPELALPTTLSAETVGNDQLRLVFAHEVLMPSAAIIHELGQLSERASRDAIVQILEFSGITGFVAENRVALYGAMEGLPADDSFLSRDSLSRLVAPLPLTIRTGFEEILEHLYSELMHTESRIEDALYANAKPTAVFEHTIRDLVVRMQRINRIALDLDKGERDAVVNTVLEAMGSPDGLQRELVQLTSNLNT